MSESRKYPPHIVRKLKLLAESDMYMKRGPRDLSMVGSRHGRLVVERVVGMNHKRMPLVLVHCDCGMADIKMYQSLLNGVKSCGCLAAERRGRIDSQIHQQMNRFLQSGKIVLERSPKDTKPAVAESVLAPSTVSVQSVDAMSAVEANLSQLDLDALAEWSKPKPKELTFKEQWEKAQRESTAAKETEGSNGEDNGNG